MSEQDTTRIASATGRTAPARKYDVITALGVSALSAGPTRQRQALRLAVLLTARYNWASDELSIGRAEIARLWHVTERTAKRELAVFRAAGWLWVKRPSARGRVTLYGVDVERILSDAAPIWPVIGPDFVARVSAAPQVEAPRNVVPFAPGAPPVPAPEPGTRWARISADLAERDPRLHSAWFARLVSAEGQGAREVLAAPSAFQASYIATHLMAQLSTAYARLAPEVQRIEIISPDTPKA